MIFAMSRQRVRHATRGCGGVPCDDYSWQAGAKKTVFGRWWLNGALRVGFRDYWAGGQPATHLLPDRLRIHQCGVWI